jgi:hypothetical protein
MPHKLHYTEPPHDQPDAWHRHIPEDEGLPQEEHGGKVRSLMLGLALLLCVAFVVGTILASYLYFQVHMTSLRRERIESTVFAQQFATSRDAELAKLGDYSFPTEDKARKGMACPPVEEAKKRVIARYAGSAGQK